jgi:predicted  nucleic acid-binding Zn-ribbon protein
MAVRARAKGKRQTTARRHASGGLGVPTHSAEWYAQRIKTLEAERDRLKSELVEAEERIGRLEESRTEAVNRIDWVLDSLHNVLETGA